MDRFAERLPMSIPRARSASPRLPLAVLVKLSSVQATPDYHVPANPLRTAMLSQARSPLFAEATVQAA